MEDEIKVSEHTAEDEIKSSDCKASAYPIAPKEPSSIQNLLQIPECRREEQQQRVRQRVEEQANDKKKAEEKRKEKEQAQREKEQMKEQI